MEIFTKNFVETQKLGEKLAADLLKGSVKNNLIALYGDLGSGKTTFVQGLAKGLGIKKRILSPTFILMREYRVDIKDKVDRLYHVDLYRIENEKDVEGLGLVEIWSEPNSFLTIEWPEKIERILPKERINIYFEYLTENERKIKIEGAY